MIIDRERGLVGVYELSIQPHMHSSNIALAPDPLSSLEPASSSAYFADQLPEVDLWLQRTGHSEAELFLCGLGAVEDRDDLAFEHHGDAVGEP